MPEQLTLETTNSADKVTNSQAHELTAGVSGDFGIRPPTDRERLLFTPYVSEQPKEDRQDIYDNILDPDAELELSVNRAAIRPKTRPITAEAEEEAQGVIEQASNKDAILKRMLHKYIQDNGIKPDEVSRALRTDQELRLSVGIHLLDKIQEHIYDLPLQVKTNAEKNPDYTGYSHLGKLRSREYTALLALSMLDGSYDSGYKRGDPVTYDPANGVGGGQHRYAARMILQLT